MLSRRDKLLLQPWEEKRFKDHRSKVRSALPAVDARAPPARPHVALKLKKCQRELDRGEKIQRDNFSLLQRLGDIMRVNRLDNHWDTPPYSSHNKVGLFYDERRLRARVAARAQPDSRDTSYCNVRCCACALRKKNVDLHLGCPSGGYRLSLPSIYSSSQ